MSGFGRMRLSPVAGLAIGPGRKWPPVPEPWRRRAVQIAADVCRERGVCLKDVMGFSQFREHVAARREAVRRIRAENDRISTTQLGSIFRRDHTMVLYYLGRRGRHASC